MTRIVLSLLLLLAACGERGSSSNDEKDSQNARVGFDYGDGSLFNPAMPTTTFSGAGGDTVQGTGQNGQLSTTELQGLQDALSQLPSSDRSQLQVVLLANLRQCSFPPAGSSNAAACRRGNGQACSKVIAGYAAGYFQIMAQRMGLSASDTAGMQNEMGSCAAIDLSDVAAVEKYIDSKTKSCQKGNRRACVGLLMFLARMFLRGLLMSLGILTA